MLLSGHPCWFMSYPESWVEDAFPNFQTGILNWRGIFFGFFPSQMLEIPSYELKSSATVWQFHVPILCHHAEIHFFDFKNIKIYWKMFIIPEVIRWDTIITGDIAYLIIIWMGSQENQLYLRNLILNTSKFPSVNTDMFFHVIK